MSVPTPPGPASPAELAARVQATVRRAAPLGSEIEFLLRPETAAPIEALCTEEHRAGECRCGIDTRPGAIPAGEPLRLRRDRLEAFEACVGAAGDREAVAAYLMAHADVMGPVEDLGFRSAAMALAQRLRAARTAVGGGWKRAASSLRYPPHTVEVALPVTWFRAADKRVEAGTPVGQGAHEGWGPLIAVELNETEAVAGWALAVADVVRAGETGRGPVPLYDARAAWLALEQHPGTGPWVESERARLEVEGRPRWLLDLQDRGLGGPAGRHAAVEALDDLVEDAALEPKLWRARYRARAQLRSYEAWVGELDRAAEAGREPEMVSDTAAVDARGLWAGVLVRSGREVPGGSVLASPMGSVRRYAAGVDHDELLRRCESDAAGVATAAAGRAARRSGAGAAPQRFSYSDVASGDVICLTPRTGPVGEELQHLADAEWGLVTDVVDYGDGLRVSTACGQVINAAGNGSVLAVLPHKLQQLDGYDDAARISAEAIEKALARCPAAAPLGYDGDIDEEGIGL